MKKIIMGILIVLCVSVVTAGTIEGYDYFVSDKVSGRNLELIEFDDELGIIDTLLYNDMLKKNSNIFKGEFSMGIPTGDGDIEYDAKKVTFNGKSTFEGGSYVKFSLEDFELEETNMDEYGTTEVFGIGTLFIEEKVIIEKEIPVEVAFLFYEDDENNDFFEQEIYMKGLDDEKIYITFQNDPDGRNTFNQKRKCYGDCWGESGDHNWTMVYTKEEGSIPLIER